MECIKMKHTILVTGANGQLGNEMRRVAQNSTHEFIFTGGAGFIGSHVVRLFENKYPTSCEYEKYCQEMYKGR